MKSSTKYLIVGVIILSVGAVVYNCDEQKVTEGGYLRHKLGGSVITLIGVSVLLRGIYLKMKN